MLRCFMSGKSTLSLRTEVRLTQQCFSAITSKHKFTAETQTKWQKWPNYMQGPDFRVNRPLLQVGVETSRPQIVYIYHVVDK